jgi:hypothetical protein
MLKAKLIIATDRSYGVHPMEGILQIHFDQLNTIAKHLEDIKRDEEAARMAELPLPAQATVCRATPETHVDPAPPPEPPPEELAQAFTKKQLLKRNDWPDWKQGIYKQLSQYWDQACSVTLWPCRKMRTPSICFGDTISKPVGPRNAAWCAMDRQVRKAL